MKNLTVKKRIERRKAKSVRNIKAYWLAMAKEAHKWCLESAEEVRELEAVTIENGNYYGHDAMVIEELKRLAEHKDVLANALCRYQQAIPKGGAC